MNTFLEHVGLASFPELADHGFQDLTVLPGAFFLELACRLHRGHFGASPGRIRAVEFLQPVLLSERETVLRIDCERGAGRTRYAFREEDASPAGAPRCAVLEIEDAGAAAAGFPAFAPVPEAVQRRLDNFGEAADFYSRLRENGNQYGPRFQGLAGLWRGEGEALGRLALSAGASELPAAWVDSAIQLLAVFFLEARRTFVLRGIEEVVRHGPRGPGPGWVHATLRAGSSAGPDGLTGELRLCDEAGICWLELRGVRATFLEPHRAPPCEIVVAATFTAEPIEETLQFWSETLEFPARVRFAPYQQVFQQLLDPGSAFRGNRDGFNVLLLNLADWAAVRPPEPGPRPADWAELPRRTLPNGLEVAHLNGHETEAVYREIFDERCYWRHGIALAGAATVIDIGANIGLFSLFVRGACPAATVYAYEPSPVAFRALQANCAAYGPQLHPFNLGVAERRGRAQLTAYDRSSVFSSFHPDEAEDRQALRAVVGNRVREALGGDAGEAPGEVEALLADRLSSRTFDCPLVSVSDIVREHGLLRVDLLKIDAEKCEVEILRGIEERHWPLIEQVVVEVHDRSGRMQEEVQEMLARRGFVCAVEEERALAGSGLSNVYAVRAPLCLPAARAERSDDLRGKVDELVRALEASAPAAGATTLVCLCPAAPDPQGPGFDRVREGIEEHLLARLRSLPQVQAICARELPAGATVHQAPAEGHVPYTAEGYAAIGTRLFRRIAALRRPPFKVIALDCDHTLWGGGCGEDGPLGVTVTAAHRRLQEFMIRQREAGMILCLCSRNLASDVWAVFTQNPGMALKRGHLSGARINWAPKSENLRSLAEEFNVGLDSVILLDDNPAECAEVRAHCPEALVLELPTDASRTAAATGLTDFLEGVWAFDHPRVTAEDRRRTRMMEEGRQREAYRGQAGSLRDFIAGLGLEVEFFVPGAAELGRLAELTLRTNQFNFTTVRRSEGDLRHFLESGGGGLAARVRDRFGDYGLVGLVLFKNTPDRCRVDTFLLSCRVLGRGVEHRILAELGRRAQSEGKKSVELVFRATDRNRPAGEFLRSLGADQIRASAGTEVGEFPAGRLAELRYEPAAGGDGVAAPRNGSARAVPSGGFPEWPAMVARIAENWRGAAEIAAAVEGRRLRRAGFGAAEAAAGLPDNLAGRLLRLWRSALGNPRIGLDDAFLECGGTSLKAVQLAAAIRRELALPVSVVTFFECPTVRLLAQRLQPEGGGAGAAGEAIERGARRKRRAGKKFA